ncbi:MAG TPA: phosphatidate cytidylyltransferase [Methylophilaceae bacterium]|nr:phosphatidate cytidylyltransferase [Methylophilaceae bacterium]
MLRARLLTSVFLIPIFLAALFLLPDILWALLMLSIIMVGVWEWAEMVKFPLKARYFYFGITLTVCLLLTFASGDDMGNLQQFSLFWGILGAAVFWIVLAPIWLISRHKIKNLYVMAVAGWLVILPAWFALVSLRRVDPWLLLGIIAAVWVADTAAYFFGKRFGKHKLAPQISPGKTWEGVLGAWVAVSIYGFALCYAFILDYWLIAALWGITVLSIMGDLLESLIKRQGDIKDSGNLLPGHGGVLDRIDGLTSSLPLAAFFIYFPLYYTAWFHYV